MTEMENNVFIAEIKKIKEMMEMMDLETIIN